MSAERMVGSGVWLASSLVQRGGLAAAAAVGVLYGGGTQYLGSIATWGAAVAGLSAPWLALPFLAGWMQTGRGRATVAGLLVTLAALVGYVVMIVSPVEGVTLTGRVVAAVFRSQWRWELAGVVGGPLLGWLGWRWGTYRSWIGPAVVAAALCLEPLDGRGRDGIVSGSEVAAGLLAGAVVLASAAARRKRPAAS